MNTAWIAVAFFTLASIIALATNLTVKINRIDERIEYLDRVMRESEQSVEFITDEILNKDVGYGR